MRHGRFTERVCASAKVFASPSPSPSPSPVACALHRVGIFCHSCHPLAQCENTKSETRVVSPPSRVYVFFAGVRYCRHILRP